jgi:hypothetical protein
MIQYAIIVEGKELKRFDSLHYAEQFASGYNYVAEDEGPPFCEIKEIDTNDQSKSIPR